MLYYSTLEQEQDKISELWVRQSGQEAPVIDYKIEGDQICLISSPEFCKTEAICLDELIDYVRDEGNPRRVLYTIVDELTRQSLDLKDRFEHKLILEVCN